MPLRSMNLRTLRYQPVVSILLVAVNVAVFLLCTFTGDLLYDKGRLDVYDVLVQKEYGRVVWALFLHGGVSHLFNNMLLLFFLGAMIEKEVGHLWYMLLYFISGIGGSLLSLLNKAMNYDYSGSIGASGAIFGLDGVLLALVLFSGKKLENVSAPRVILMIVYSLYNGYTGTNIDNAAHVGGLITGFVAAGILCVLQRWKRERKS